MPGRKYYGGPNQDMRYALENYGREMPYTRPTNWGPGARDAVNETRSARPVQEIITTGTVDTTEIDARISAAREATATAKAAYDAAAKHEKELVEERKVMLKFPSFTDKELEKEVKNARRERALASHATGAVAAAERPVGVQKKKTGFSFLKSRKSKK